MTMLRPSRSGGDSTTPSASMSSANRVRRSRPPFRMGGLPPAEHDRDLDLRALVEEANDVALLGLVVLNGDLRSELDLLDVDLGLVLSQLAWPSAPPEPVLAVVHDPGDWRLRLRRHLDEVEVLAVGIVEGFAGGFDPDLGAVIIDQPNLWDANPFVDPRLGFGRWLLRSGETPWPQRLFTKLFCSSFSTTKPLHAAASDISSPHLNPRLRVSTPLRVRNGCAPTCRLTD